MSLPEIQDFVIGAITRPASLVDDTDFAALGKRVTTGNARLTATEQLDIYREQFWLRHTGALQEDFLSAERLLGEDAFFELCALYMKAHEPQSYTLRDLGDRFVDFVATTAPYKDDALLVDLCRIEWAFVEAFDAADAEPISAQKIASTPEEAWPNAVLVLHPALRLVALRHPAHDLRIAARTGATEATHSDAIADSGMCETHPAATCASAAPTTRLTRPEAKDTYVVVFRGSDVLKFIDIEREAFVLLSKLHAGTPLGRACEETVKELALDETAFEGSVGGWFSTWTQWGWVTDLVT